MDIKSINFKPLIQFVEKSSDILDHVVGKIPSLKVNITKTKKSFEEFKFSIELGRSIYSLIEILKYQDSFDEEQFLFEENKIYCVEFTKLIFENEKGQEMFKNLKLKSIQTKELTERYSKRKAEIDKLIQEWESVKMLYDLISSIVGHTDIEFITENFKDKKYLIVSHENFENIENIFKKGIKNLNDALAGCDAFIYSQKVLGKVNDFKQNLVDVYQIVVEMRVNQELLEHNMSKTLTLQKKPELFMKLKQVFFVFKS
jgi:hypothetical protein